jgi:hypothetical protein
VHAQTHGVKRKCTHACVRTRNPPLCSSRLAFFRPLSACLQDLVGSLQQHIHEQNEVFKDVQKAIQEPKLAAYDDTSVTARIRDLQQVVLKTHDTHTHTCTHTRCVS